MPEPPPWVDADLDPEYESRPEPRAAVRATRNDSPFPAPSRRDAPLQVDEPPAEDEPFLPRAAVAPVIAAAAPVVPIPTTEQGDRWAQAVREMAEQGSIMAMVRELALQSQCMSIGTEEGVAVWRIRVERETLRGSASCEKLQAALSALLGEPVRLLTEAGATEDTPAKRDAAARARRQLEAEQIIQSDPLVQSLLAQYKTARIVPGSVKPH